LYWLAITEEALGERAQATAVAELALRVGVECSHALMISMAHQLRRHLLVLRHELAEAAPGSDNGDFLNPLPMTLSATPDLVQVLYLLALATPTDLRAARVILDGWVEFGRTTHVDRRMIEVLALRAAVCQALGDLGQALADLREALQLAEPHGLVRFFVDVGSPIAGVFFGLTDAERDRPFVRQIMGLLSALAEKKPAAPALLPAHVTLLTAREMDVLLLMSERYSDKEIAVRLYISVATVKRHTANIYEKLHVSGRRQAVAAAQSLGILPTPSTSSPTSFIHP
jgi:LuxR family maltose regulon positive regulatory protein